MFNLQQLTSVWQVQALLRSLSVVVLVTWNIYVFTFKIPPQTKIFLVKGFFTFRFKIVFLIAPKTAMLLHSTVVRTVHHKRAGNPLPVVFHDSRSALSVVAFPWSPVHAVLCSLYADCRYCTVSKYLSHSRPQWKPSDQSQSWYQDDQSSLPVLRSSDEDVQVRHQLPGHLPHHRQPEGWGNQGEHCGAEGGVRHSTDGGSASSTLQEMGNTAQSEDSQCKHQYNRFFPNIREFFSCDINVISY